MSEPSRWTGKSRMNNRVHREENQPAPVFGGSWEVALLLAAAALLRLCRLSAYNGLGVDEATTALNSLGSLQQAVLWDKVNNPPFQHVVLNLVGRVSHSEAMLRLPAALFGIGCVYFTFRLVDMLVTRRAGLFAGLLVALSPFHVVNSMNVRMYSALLFFCVGSLWFLVAALRTQRLRHWLGVGGTLVLALYTHYLSVSFVAVHWGVILSMARGRRSAKRLLLAHLGALALFAPWLWAVLLPAVRQQVGSSGDVTVAFLTGFTALLDFLFHVSGSLQTTQYPLPVAVGFVLALLLLAFSLDALRRRPEALAALGGGFLFPFALMLFISSTNWRHVTQQFLLALPMFLALCAVGLDALQGRWRALAWVYGGPVLALMLFSNWNYLFNPACLKTDWRAACHYVRDGSAPGDVAFLVAENTTPPFDYYVGERVRHYGLPGGLVRVGDYPKVAARCEELAEKAPRVWLIESGSQPIGDPDRQVYRWCRENYVERDSVFFDSIRIRLFDRR